MIAGTGTQTICGRFRRSHKQIPGFQSLTSASRVCRLVYIMARNMSITETLRRAINESGQTFLGLERETGVIRQSLMPFARGETSISLAAADKLAEYFGLELLPSTKPKRTRKGK